MSWEAIGTHVMGGDKQQADGPSVVVIAGTSSVVAIAPPLTDALRDELQRAMEGDDAAVAVVSALTTNGVRDLPPFAYVGREGATARLLLRGDIQAVEREMDGTETVHAAGPVSTWSEVVRQRSADVTLRTSEGALLAIITFRAPPTSTDAVARPSDDREAPAASVPDLLLEETMPPGPDPDVLVGASNGPVDAALPVASDTGDVDLSHLFETRHVGVEAAAVRVDEADVSVDHEPGVGPQWRSSLPAPPPPAPSPPAPSPPPPPPSGLIEGIPGREPEPVAEAGDHDGLTMTPGQFAALRSTLSESAGPADPAGTSLARGGPRLQAVVCPSGHMNPPQSDTCRTCGTKITDRTVHVISRPSLGRLSFEGGMVAAIDRPLLLGRKPTAEGLPAGAEVPGLVALPDPDGSLSRVHAEIRLEGWEVLVVDRGSTNGTRVEVPGQPPVLLRPNEPFLMSPGTTITMADVVTCTFESATR